MKINFCKNRKPNKMKFSQIDIGTPCYYEWYTDDIRIKISKTEYFSFVSNTIREVKNIDEKGYIKVKAEINVYRG